MIKEGRYEPRDCPCYGPCAHDEGLPPTKVTTTASEPDESEAERLVRLCNRDIRRGIEEGRFEIETPRGHVEQDALRNLSIHIKWPTDNVLGQVVRGPPLIGIEFALSVEHEGITTDLSSFDTDVVVYGDQHVWNLTDPWSADIAHDGFAIGDEPVYDHEHWWGTAEEIDFRD